MKILTISSTDITEIGGVNFSIKKVAGELVRRGHECHVLAINPGNLPKNEIIDGINVIRISSPISRHLYQFSPEMGKYLHDNFGKSIDPDITHIHEYRRLLTPEVAYFLKTRNARFVFSPHYSRGEYSTLAGRYLLNYYKPIGRKIFDWAAEVIVHSEYTREVLAQDFDVRPEKIRTIPHGIENMVHAKCKQPKAASTPILLLYAGVLLEKKGVQYIIQAIKELKDRGRKPCLTIIGQGNYEPQLKILSRNLGVEENISWARPVSRLELQRTFADSDIFLLLSRAEAYGIVVTEALASGTACIVSKSTSLNEFLIEPGCFGINYPPDPREVADLIIKIHESAVQIGPFSDKIRTWDKVAEDYEKIYERIIG